jgi:alpha-glucosidase
VSRTASNTGLTTDPTETAGAIEPAATDWWRHAVFYQVYPRSFADSNGDGIGDLEGVRSRLDYLQLLGVDALWLSPFFKSPMADHGYDVSDPRDVDPIFGTLDDFDALLRDSHERGIKITIDVVPNHFSDQHPWFIAARSAAPGSAERARFIFREGKGANGELPPNNWPSVFGGPAWTRLPDGQWYLHIFAPEQPDLNWENTEVIVEFAEIFKFWLDRGVDGFRIDVAHGMAKPEGLPDLDHLSDSGELTDQINGDLRWDQDGVHEIHRGFRRVLDAYPGTMAVGEAWVPDDSRLALYVRPDELHLTFNFELVSAHWGAAEFRSAIDDSIHAMAEVGAPCSWVLSNHDVDRHVSRYGGGAVGLSRGRAAALLQLALPGAAYLYNGDELGLENVELPDWALQDPTWERSGHTTRGRDGERVPIPWEGSAAPYGFTSGASTWLPMPADWESVTAEAELGDAASTLSMYRHALELRHDLVDLRSSAFGWQGAPSGCLAFRRGPHFICAANFSDQAVALPPGELLLSSSPTMDPTAPGSVLPANTAVWLRA